MERIEVRLDVSGFVALPGISEMAATIFLPERGFAPTMCLFAVPGGGYNRHYYDLHFPTYGHYSQAEHHVAHGAILIAIDHIGVGDSSIPDLSAISIADMADALAGAVSLLSIRLAEGTLAADLEPHPGLLRVGLGQSMGGCVTIAAQARHRCWDAIGVLGFSAVQVVLPQADPAAEARNRQRHKDAMDTGGRPIQGAIALEGLRWPFFWEDVPEALIDEDFAGGYPVRETAPSFGSLTMPHCAVTMLNPGVVAPEAAVIDTPVLLVFGERDVSAAPHREPAAYPQSGDVTLLVVPRMAHMHNFASSRAALWDRLLGWAAAIPQGTATPLQV